jgi:hypothetical protein
VAPPPPPSSSQTIEFGRPFLFVFEDPDWIKKILIGGLFYLAAFLIVGIFFVFGYAVHLARNVMQGAPRPLPEWDDLGGIFVDGVKVTIVSLIYAVPLILVWLLLFGGMAAIGAFGEEQLEGPAAGMVGCFMPIFILLVLAYSVFLPAALLMYVASGSIGEALNMRKAIRFVINNPANYVLAFIINLIANFISQFGIILLCIGVLFTSFWAVLVSAYAFADAYRLAKTR